MYRVNVGRTFQFDWSKQKLRPTANTFHPVRVSGYGHEEQLLRGEGSVSPRRVSIQECKLQFAADVIVPEGRSI